VQKTTAIKFVSTAGLLLTSIMAANTAIAQESKAGFGIEEVTVTARKVEENLQDVPVAVSAFTGEALERRQISGTDDIGKITPNLEFTNNAPLAGNNSSSMVFIRGIGQVSARANVDPGVGLYIDDVYMGQSVGGTMEMRDIAGVQVLRGPQGTLFGRNTIGGAVLLTTTEPGDEFGGKIRAGVGSDNLREIFAAVDVPISDDLKTRWSMGTKLQDGYVKRLSDGTDLGDTNNYTLTGKAFYTPTDELTLKLMFDYTEADENGSPLVFAAYNNNTDPLAVAGGPPEIAGFFGANRSVQAGCVDAFYLPAGPGATVTVGATGNREIPARFNNGVAIPVPPGPPQGYTAENNDPSCANNQWYAGPYANNGTAPLESTLENWGASFHLIYDFSEEMTFKSITSYRDLSWRGMRDADNMPFAILHTDYQSSGDQLSQEFQLLYTGDSLTGVAGVYYYQEEVKDILTVTLGYRDSLDSDNNITDNDNWALFTQWTYDFNEQLSATFGARYTEENKGSIPDQFNYADPDTKYLPVQLYEEKFTATTITASINYRWNDSLMTYASYSEGFKGGGWNSSFNVPQSQEALDSFHQFDQEEAQTLEIGFKADLLDDMLRINGAIFSTDYTDLQFIFRVGPAPYLLNAGEAKIEGAELEVTWVPSSSWIIEAGLGYLDDSINSVSADFTLLGASTPITTDNTLPFTPELQGNLGIGYTFNAGSLTVTPRVDVTYKDKTFFDTANSVEVAQNDAITTVDASVAIETADEVWRLVLGVNNATDEEYPIAGNSSLTSGSGYAEIAYARPRQFFANLSYNF